MKRFILVTLLFIVFNNFSLAKAIVPSQSKAKPTISDLCVNRECPIGTPNDNIIINHGLIILSSNRATKFADWVAYKVESRYFLGENRRNWKKDPEIDSKYTLSPNDYKDASRLYKYDRGHQAPLANFSNHESYAVVNSLSNITPQKADLNQGSWARLERAERNLFLKHNYANLYVITGPYYTENLIMPKLPNARLKHMVPSGYFKIFITINRNKSVNYGAFLFSQLTPRYDPYCNHKVSINDVEKLTKLELLPNMITHESSKIYEDLGCQAIPLSD